MSPEEPVHLQPWYDRWCEEHKETDLIYARGPERSPRQGPHLRQVHVVRDQLAALFWRDVPHEQRRRAMPRDDCRETALVIGEHYSKSVRLPVYMLDRPGLRIVLRDNFHDWNVSVLADWAISSAVADDLAQYYADDERKRFDGGYRPGAAWGYCYFQGFPKEYAFGPYAENPRRFSLWANSDFDLYVFLWLLMREYRRTPRDLGWHP